MYDVKFHQYKRRAQLYSDASKNNIIRPYSKIQASVCDFNFFDDLAIVSEPIGIQRDYQSFVDSDPLACDFNYADQFLAKISHNVNVDKFFHPNEI
jgi:hypothetical protein